MYKCAKCAKCFIYEGAYTKHLTSSCSVEMNSDVLDNSILSDLKCNACNKYYSNNFSLNRHIKTCKKINKIRDILIKSNKTDITKLNKYSVIPDHNPTEKQNDMDELSIVLITLLAYKEIAEFMRIMFVNIIDLSCRDSIGPYITKFVSSRQQSKCRNCDTCLQSEEATYIISGKNGGKHRFENMEILCTTCTGFKNFHDNTIDDYEFEDIKKRNMGWRDEIKTFLYN